MRYQQIAKVENAGVSSMKCHPEIILNKEKYLVEIRTESSSTGGNKCEWGRLKTDKYDK